jgi:hypothetical protein
VSFPTQAVKQQRFPARGSAVRCVAGGMGWRRPNAFLFGTFS